MDGADWLRTQLTSFGCAACGRAYEPEGIRLLAEREELYFVDLSCLVCGSQATAIVTVELDEGAVRADAPDLEPAADGAAAAVARPAASGPRAPATVVAGRDPVDLDDVLDIHQLLAGYEGDMLGLLRRLDGAEGTIAR